MILTGSHANNWIRCCRPQPANTSAQPSQIVNIDGMCGCGHRPGMTVADWSRRRQPGQAFGAEAELARFEVVNGESACGDGVDQLWRQHWPALRPPILPCSPMICSPSGAYRSGRSRRLSSRAGALPGRYPVQRARPCIGAQARRWVDRSGLCRWRGVHARSAGTRGPADLPC
jgi:hypothetical protein